MKALITGAGGFLGRQVLARLLAHGHTDVRCFLRDPAKTGQLQEIAKAYPGARVEYLYGNLRTLADSRAAVDGVSLVFHLAAGLKGSCADLFLNSVVASKVLLEALESRTSVPLQETRIVLVSSFGVYGVAGLPRGAMVEETTPLEPHPEWRDFYSYSKLRQEQLFWEAQSKDHFELVVLRPGVIYGPGGGHFSGRVGIQVGPVFLHLGGRNLLPITYVENCAEAIVVAGTHPASAGQVYNVHDDGLVTAAHYLRQYKKHVRKVRSLRLPYFATWALAWELERYHRRTMGQLPAVLTRYKVAASWRGNRFRNQKLHSIGWSPIVSTPDALAQTFEYFRQHPAP